MHELVRSKAQINERIVQATRPIIPVLLDAGRAHSAEVLQALYFELDAKDQELQAFVLENMDNILKSMRG
jgi:hypothetical protein